MDSNKFLNFKTRKVIQYFLFLCILVIQAFIALFFYSEYQNKKNTSFIEKQLQNVDFLERFTDHTKVNFNKANANFQQYLKTKDPKDLQIYYQSISDLTSGFERIESHTYKNDYLKDIYTKRNEQFPSNSEVKTYVDSVTKEVHVPVQNNDYDQAVIKKFKVNLPTISNVDVETQTYSEPVKKKKLFGRLADAFSGKESVRKDSTVVTLKQVIADNAAKSRKLIDSIINHAHKHYVKEIRNVEVSMVKQQSNFNSKNIDELIQLHDLLNYSANLMTFYDSTIKTVKNNLEKELDKQRSKNDQRRLIFAIAAMALMFLVSILMLYFTRLAFFYEEKFRAADKMNRENLNFKNRILGMLSHELRSPLKVIGLFVNRIQKKTSDETIKEYLKSINYTSNTLLLQSNQILEYTKNQHVQNKLVSGRFMLKQEIDAILASIEPYIETRHNQFVTQVDIDPTIEVDSDKAKMNQVFINIIGNANKFTENGSITVKTMATKGPDGRIQLNTDITDTGAGISEDDLKSIFEPYYQGVLSNDVENLGAGLGLSLCKEIVNLFEGSISAKSKLGVGTTVSFTLHLNSKN